MITPIGLTPVELVDKCHDNGAKLVVVGDSSHSELQIKATVNGILKGSKLNHYLDEWPRNDQYAYTNFNHNDDSALRKLIFNPHDYHAPDPTLHPERRERYYDTKWDMFVITQARRIPVTFIDDRNLLLSFKANKAHNNLFAFNSSCVIAETLRDSNGLPINLDSLSADALNTIKSEIADNMNANRMGWDGSTVTAAKLKETAKTAFEVIGLAYDQPHTPVEIALAEAKQRSILVKQKNSAENDRDAWRDAQMAPLALKSIEAKGTRALLLVGSGHLGALDEGRTSPNMEHRLREKLGEQVVRVDIVPVAADKAAALGVCIGGQKGADYTIFVPGESTQFHCVDSHNTVPAIIGPHQNRLKILAPSTPASDMESAASSPITQNENDYLNCVQAGRWDKEELQGVILQLTTIFSETDKDDAIPPSDSKLIERLQYKGFVTPSQFYGEPNKSALPSNGR